MSTGFILYGIQLLRYTWSRGSTAEDTAFLDGLRTGGESIETVVTTPFITDDLSTALAWVDRYQVDEMAAIDVGWYKAQGDNYSWESNDGRIMAITVYDNVLLTKI